MATSQETLQTALAHHQAGRLREAETLYRRIIEAEPGHANAWHLLGLVAYQAGQLDAAEQLIGRAIALAGNRGVYHSNLGAVLVAREKLDQAEASLRQALALDPKLPDAYNNLGNVLRARGQTDAAINAYREAIRLRSGFAEPHNNLGTVLHARGELNEAVAHYHQALEQNPRYVEAYNNLGTALKAQGQFDQAADAYRQALRLAPGNDEAQINLGTVFQSQGRLDEALACYREALAMNPRSALAHNNIGAALREQGRTDEAEQCYRQALEIDPRLADAHFNLAVVRQAEGALDDALVRLRQAIDCDPRHAGALTQLGKLLEAEGRLDEALALLDRALEANPRHATAHLARGHVYKLMGRTSEALADFHAALDWQPQYPEAHNHLAVMYDERGQHDAAVEHCRQGLEQDPRSGALLANLATALSHQGRQVESVEVARQALERQPENVVVFSNLLYNLNFLPDYDPACLFQEHLEWARLHAEPLTVAAAAHANDPAPDRRLRVGYVSPYFREHAVNFFTEPLIASHDREVVEVFCYSDVRVADAITARLQAAADHWREVRYRSDEELAQMIRQDGIDILVDLTGHIANHRLLTFARRPAPVQVTYIGYQNTTGMSAMDYRLTDAHADPPGTTEAYHTERLARLPRAYFCYRPGDEAPEVTPLPAIETGHVTFGAFNNFSKVTPQAIDAWMEILARVPGARLLTLANRGGYIQQNLEERARARGIDAARIEVNDRLPRAEYYRLLQRADAALDPFPFNGHTTTCDCIWMGVPVVMLLGQVYASRFGSSVLRNVGLDEWIARSVDEYVERAVDLASDLDRLAGLRMGLRPCMAASPLLDFRGFARNVETAYRQMWGEWCERTRLGRG